MCDALVSVYVCLSMCKCVNVFIVNNSGKRKIDKYVSVVVFFFPFIHHTHTHTHTHSMVHFHTRSSALFS